MGDIRREWGTFRKLPSGKYQASYLGPDGQRHRGRTTFDDKDAARIWLRREKRLIDDGEWISPADRQAKKVQAPSITFGDYSSEWLDRRRTRKGPIKDGTRADYSRLLDLRLLPTFGKLPLRSITPAMIETWYEKQTTLKTPTMTAHAYGLLHAIMTRAASTDATGSALIPFNPCQILGAQKAPTQHDARPATARELQDIIAAMPERHQLAIALLGWCALRFGEAIALERRDIDPARRRLKIRKAVVRVNNERKLDTPKNHRQREVTYPPHLDALVENHLAHHAQKGPTGKLFPSSTGGYLSQSTLNGKPARRRRIKGRMVNESATGFRKACDTVGHLTCASMTCDTPAQSSLPCPAPTSMSSWNASATPHPKPPSAISTSPTTATTRSPPTCPSCSSHELHGSHGDVWSRSPRLTRRSPQLIGLHGSPRARRDAG